MRSSLGFHTFTIYKRLSMRLRNTLLKDFRRYASETELVRVRPMRDNFGNRIYNSHIIEYTCGRKGLTWSITYNAMLGDNPYIVRATINPKILIGTKDYIAAASVIFMKDVMQIFDLEARQISRNLEPFSSYFLGRIDYCVNFDLKELGLACTPQQIIKLIKQSAIPLHFEERTEYDEIAHRKKTNANSFYLQSNSVVINCYWKYWQLKEQDPNCESLEDSSNIIRFEVQCKYYKVQAMKGLFSENRDYCNMQSAFFSDNLARDIIVRYFDSIIGRGDYYTLDLARRIVRSRQFKPQKEQRLIADLELVNRKQGVANARAILQGQAREDFNRSLRELDELNINPVTIPKDWGIAQLPNLIEAYNQKVAIEKAQDAMFENLLYEERSKKHRKKKDKKKKSQETFEYSSWVDSSDWG